MEQIGIDTVTYIAHRHAVQAAIQLNFAKLETLSEVIIDLN